MFFCFLFVRGARMALAAPLLAWLLCLVSPGATARSVLDLDASKQPIALADWGEYWIDSKNQLTPEQVATESSRPWKPTLLGGSYPLLAGQALWMRFTVPPAPDAERWLLEIPDPALDRASLYSLDKAGQWLEQRVGDLTPVNQWPMPHRHPLMAVKFNAEEPTYYLLRIENAQGFSAPIRFVSGSYLFRSEQRASMFLGIYLGIAVLGSAIGLIGLLWLRDRAYFYYGLSAVLIGLSQSAINGAGALHLWPESAQWADCSLVVLLPWMLLSLLLLNTTVVSLAQRSRVLNALAWLVALAGVVLSAASGFTDASLRLELLAPYVLGVPALIVLINLWAWRRGDHFGGWLLLATIPLLISLLLAIALYLQWVPTSFAVEQGILAGLALELPALLVVVLLRSQQRRENLRRIRGLDRIDPATGLINADVFAVRLSRMVARAKRTRQQGAVMLVDIMNTEQMQRDFGRKTVDELPLRVAARLLTTAREIDTAARLSERRFGMLVEGPFSAEDAASLGPRIVARCLMPYPDLDVKCAVQVRVAYALVPYQACDAQALLFQLDQRLAMAPADAKKAVFMLGEPPAPQRRASARPRPRPVAPEPTVPAAID